MIDIHSHLLPGLDDGAQSEQETIELARNAVADGIHTVIATPHHANGHFLNNKQKVLEAVEACNALLKRHGIPLTVLPGQEIRIHDQWLDEWAQDQLLDLASSGYVLMEFPFSHMPSYTLDLIHELAIRGWKPVIAHPERNRELAGEPEKLLDLIDSGALVQVTSHSVMGTFGRTVQKLSLDWIARRMVHLIASDAHHAVKRPFALREAYRIIEHKVGRSLAEELKANAEKLISRQPIEIPEPLPKKKRFWSWKISR